MSASASQRPPSPAPHTSPHSSHGQPPHQAHHSASASSSRSSSPAPTAQLADAALEAIVSHLTLLCTVLLSPSADQRAKLDLLLRIIEYSKSCVSHSTDLAQLLPDEGQSLFRALRLLTADKDPTLRAQSLRTLRYAVNSAQSVQLFYQLNIDLFLIRSLERDSKYLWERLQAFKLYKRLMALAPQHMTRALVQSILAMAELPKDDFRRVSLHEVREMMLSIPQLVCSCNGLRVLVDSILDPACSDMAGSLALTLLYVLDQPHTRQLLRPQLDITRLLAVFTDTAAPDSPDREARRLAAHRCLVTMMRSWGGILALTEERGGLSSLVGVLSLPMSVKGASWGREAVFDLLLEVVGVVKANDIASSVASAAQCGHNLLHSYQTVILLSLIDCGLLHTLTQLSSSLDGEFRGVATKLLLELLALASHLLPAQLCRQLNALPSVMASAASFGSEGYGESGRVRALSLINVLSEEGSSSGMSAVGGEWGELHDGVAAGRKEQAVHDIFTSSSSATVQHGIYLLRYMQNTDFLPASSSSSASSTSASLLASLRQHVDHSIDDRELEALIKRTCIPATKDFRQWDTQLILQLLEGPLASSQAALITAMTRHKFIKRICSFLRPEKLLFSCMDYTAPHLVYVRIAVALFRVMLACSEGREYAYFVQLVDNMFDTVLGEIGRGRSDDRKSSGGSGKDGGGKDGGTSAHHAHSSSVQYGLHPQTNGSHAHSSSVSASHRPRLSVDDSDLVGGGGGLSPRHALQHSRTLSRITRSKHKPSYRCLSRPNLKRKLSQAYFLLIGLLSSSRYGMSYFDKFGLYDHLYNLCSDHSKDYLTRCFILHLDYTERTARTLLETWLKGGSVGLRKFAVSFLRSVVRSQPSSSHWTIGMIVAQLTHSDASLRAATLSVLQEMAVDPSYLVLLIKKKPQLSHCGLLAQPLQSIFLSSKAGLEYVGGGSGVVGLMRQWKHEGCVRYVESLERCLWSALSGDEGKDREGSGGSGNSVGAGQGGAAAGNGGSNKAAAKTGAAEEKRGNSLQVDKGLAATSVQTSALTTSSSSSNLSTAAQTAANNNRSSSPTPSSPPPHSPTPQSPASAPSLPWFFFAPTPRTSLDDYFLSRLHALPWSVELTADWPNGRTNVLMPTDCYLFSSPYELPSKDDEDGDAGTGNGAATGTGNGSTGNGSGGSAAGVASCVHPVRTFLVCVLLDSHGHPAPYRLDHSVTMRARLTLGGGQSDRSEPEVISRPLSAVPSALSTPSSASRHLSSPFRTPTSSPRAGHHSPHLSTSLVSLPSMSEYDSQADDREWMKQYFTYPLAEHVCRPAMRLKQNLDTQQSVAVSAGGSGGPTALRGALHTATKDDDRCKWAFNLTPAALPPAPRRDRTNSQSTAAPAEHFDWMLESIMFPIALPSDGVSSVCVPRHLYGELVQTAEGCDALRQSGCVDDFVRTVMTGEEEWYEGVKRARAESGGSTAQSGSARATPAASPASMRTSISSHHLPSHHSASHASSSASLSASAALQKRAALWSLGHIASTALGLSLLPPDLLSFISTSAVSHPTLSFRGTCYYLLSLVTRSPAGRATLERMGWQQSTNPQVGVVVPGERMEGGKDFLRIGFGLGGKGRTGGWATDRSNLYGIPMRAGKGSGSAQSSTSPSSASTVVSSVPPLRAYSEAELDILLHISNLCNYVTQARSLTSLRAMRLSSSFQPLFASPALLLDAMRMLAVYSFRLQARRFLLFDLFSAVQFTEHSIAVFDGVFLPSDRAKEDAEAKAERDRRLLLSPPVLQARALASGTVPTRRARPPLVNLPPPHSKPAPAASPVPPAMAAAAAAAGAAPVDSGGKVKVISVGRDRSLSVPSRVGGAEYRGAGHDEVEEEVDARRGAVVVVGTNGGGDLSGESDASPISGSPLSRQSAVRNAGVGSLSYVSPRRGLT